MVGLVPVAGEGVRDGVMFEVVGVVVAVLVGAGGILELCVGSGEWWDRRGKRREWVMSVPCMVLGRGKDVLQGA
jgi:hypothetical protein